MNTTKFKLLIDEIKDENSVEEAHLGFFYGNEHQNYECCIKGNKQGIIRYGIELLEAGLNIEDHYFKEDNIYTFSNDWNTTPSDLCITHVELLSKLKSEIEPLEEYKETFRDVVLKFFLFGVFFFILISILVGAFSILSWIF